MLLLLDQTDAGLTSQWHKHSHKLALDKTSLFMDESKKTHEERKKNTVIDGALDPRGGV